MIKRRLVQRSRVLILTGLLAPVGLVTVLTFFLYRSQAQLAESAQWIAHTQETQRGLHHLGSEMVNAEAAQRGFLLTSNTVYLEPYYAALAKVPEYLAQLRKLVADDASQRSNLLQVEAHVVDKLQFMRENVNLAQSGQYPLAVAAVLTGRGRDAMERIRLALTRMTNEELTLLNARQDHLARQFSRHARMAMALVVLNILFAGAILFLLRRESQARAWARICAWSRTIEYEGEWLTFEQYLQRRFDYRITHGMSPQVLDEMRRNPNPGDEPPHGKF